MFSRTDIDQEYLHIYFKPLRQAATLDKLNGLLSEIPFEILQLRSSPFNVTDRVTKIQYQISTNSEGHIQINFKKKDLHKCDIEKLIKSLDIKLESQLRFATHFLYNSRLFFQQLNNNIITQMEYSPTDLVFKMQFGKIMSCQFYLSHVIGNQLMDENDRFLRFMILNSEFNDINQGKQKTLDYFKLTPLNLCLLLQQKYIEDFMDLLHHTYIPIQVLQQKLNDYFTCQTFVNFIYFIPTERFGIFQFCIKNDKQNRQYFKHDSSQIIVQINSKFEQDKIYFELEAAKTYIEEQEIQGVCNFATFREDFYKVFQKRLMSKIYEIEDFFQQFINFSLLYFFFSSKRELIIQIIKRHSFEAINNKIVITLIQKMGTQFYSYVTKNNRLESISDSQKKQYLETQKKIFTIFADRLLYAIYLSSLDDRDIFMKNLLRHYQDKLERNVNTTLKLYDLKPQDELLQQLQCIWFQLEDNGYSMFINHQHITQYKFQDQQITKITPVETQNFTPIEFAKTQAKYIAQFFPDVK